jgi:murein L,D-transpeptidase YafK
VRRGAIKTGVLRLVASIVVAVFVFLSMFLRSREALPADARADYLLVEKTAHKMTLFNRGQPIKTYRVALGRGGAGQKVQAGDNRVPEGLYQIAGRNPHSAFHQALRISYPLPEQVADANKRGVNAGGDIMIHGIRNGLGWLGTLQRHVDWTKGCIAVDDDEIEEIWRVVPDGTPVEIRP